MNKSNEIFQEIENKLIKDDYASTLPNYHPAKGRRTKGLLVSLAPHAPGFNSSVQSQDPFPDPEEPGKSDPGPEIENPDKEEIDPSRDFPQRDIEYPRKEEFPDENPNPEIGDPNQEEFYL